MDYCLITDFRTDLMLLYNKNWNILEQLVYYGLNLTEKGKKIFSHRLAKPRKRAFN